MSYRNDKQIQLNTGSVHSNISQIGNQAIGFLECMAPYLNVKEGTVKQYLAPNSTVILNEMRFFKILSCTTEDIEDIALFFKERMDKLFTALHALNTPIVYGIVSNHGHTNLILGIRTQSAQHIVESLLRGFLSGIELTPYSPAFSSQDFYHAERGGIISAVPVRKIDDNEQTFDISSIMRSLNGQNYSVIFVAHPYSLDEVCEKYNIIVNIRDNCFAASKRNLSYQTSETNTSNYSSTQTKTHSGNVILYSYSSSKSISESIATALGTSDTVAHDEQNGFALELMEYCDKALERLREGQNVGMWGTAVAYSADNKVTADIINACLKGELAKSVTDILPLRQYAFDLKEPILLPYLDSMNQLLAPITSAELGMLCTLPDTPVPYFELKQGKAYPMVTPTEQGIVVGKVSDGYKAMENMPFALSESDLNKHTFVCGITGSGKTTTVKGILKNCPKPFMVLESAKKEYRNMVLSKGRKPLTIYTLGKTELNCPQFNPFYIQCGLNLQTHIDYLKDLFNASFSFYGPMPYILEKCLYNIYRKKGWNLTLGYHPRLINHRNTANIFDAAYMEKQYASESHKYLFPTMQDLKNEVKRYVEQEMQYDGEVAGNIKTAIIARLESLCVGSKGFMLNTYTPINMAELMNENAVFELEGLADNSDKAFCVGLLVIYINEYRQLYKDRHPHQKFELQHLLVIEEAHRLLKNIDTERSSEQMGNPQGKAVEHFTNMIAEMRSYGQGVIIAEQIPSKLTPDVIKNTSNKIIQRVVSGDDQKLIANTIGLKEEDTVYLGNLKTGEALCHKEGMNLPIHVFVDNVSSNSIPDDALFTSKERSIFQNINYSLVRENTVSLFSNQHLHIKMLNSFLLDSPERIIIHIENCRKSLEDELVKENISLIKPAYTHKILAQILTEKIMGLLVVETYSFNILPDNTLHSAFIQVFEQSTPSNILRLKDLLQKAYLQNSRNRCLRIIAELIKMKYTSNVNLSASVGNYLFENDPEIVNEIHTMINRR